MSGAISGTTLAVMGISAAAGVGSAVIGANAAGNAANSQVSAANRAADLQYQESQNALNFQKQQYNQSQANMAPWLQSGAEALSNLDYLLGMAAEGGGAGQWGVQAPGMNPPPQGGQVRDSAGCPPAQRPRATRAP